MYSRRLALLLALMTLAVACGRKEAPKPPPSRVPAAANDLTVQQRGMEIILRLSYPTLTIGGLALDNLEAVEIWEARRFIPSFIEGATEIPEEEGEGPATSEPEALLTDTETLPEDDLENEQEGAEESPFLRLPSESSEEESKETLIQVSPHEFDLQAQLRWTVRGPELTAAAVGDLLLIRLPIEAISQEEEVLVFGARAVAGRRLVSPVSNLAKIMPRNPPPAPGSLKVEPQPNGVMVSWESPGEIEGFRVYRREAEIRDYGQPLFAAPDSSASYLDTTAQFGRRYIYTVTSMSSKLPLVESAIVAEHEVDYQDRFPPAPPREVVALAESGRVRLLWESSVSQDVKGYQIFRQDTTGEFQMITPELVLGSEYLDRDLASGRIYRYFIVAVDGADNLSEATDEIEARVP